jgi:hypothetical protein
MPFTFAYRSKMISTRQPRLVSQTNYFTVTQNYGMIIDASFRIIISDNVNLRWNIVKCTGAYGGWYGNQTLISNGTASTPMSYADDVNSAEYFFEIYDVMTGAMGVWRTKKDGTVRTQIYTSGAGGTNPSGGYFDKTADKVVWTLDSGAPIGVVRRCDRTGGGVENWDLWGTLAIQARGVGVFDDARYVLYDVTHNLTKLFTGWGGTLVQSITLTAPPIWFSMDNINNRVYCSNNEKVMIWDIATNAELIVHSWGGSDRGQAVYRPEDGFVYTKTASGSMQRWNYITAAAETWDGAQYFEDY